MLLEDQNFSSIRYMNPLTKVLCQNYIIAACNPLYTNFVKLDNESYQQYGEKLKETSLEIYQRPMNNDLNVRLEDGSYQNYGDTEGTHF